MKIKNFKRNVFYFIFSVIGILQSADLIVNHSTYEKNNHTIEGKDNVNIRHSLPMSYLIFGSIGMIYLIFINRNNKYKFILLIAALLYLVIIVAVDWYYNGLFKFNQEKDEIKDDNVRKLSIYSLGLTTIILGLLLLYTLHFSGSSDKKEEEKSLLAKVF